MDLNDDNIDPQDHTPKTFPLSSIEEQTEPQDSILFNNPAMASLKGSIATDAGIPEVGDLNGVNDDEIVQILMRGAEDDVEAKEFLSQFVLPTIR